MEKGSPATPSRHLRMRPFSPSPTEEVDELPSTPIGYLGIQAYEALAETLEAEQPLEALLSPSGSSAPLSFQGRDWNSEYQAACEGGNAADVRKVVREFKDEVRRQAPFVVRHQAGVPATGCKYSIKPLNDLGGTAGGSKLLVDSIFWKFALDNNGLYGGDEFSAKSAGHEARSIELLRQVSNGLSYPLIVLVDYAGYRLVALSVLPISDRSIRLGSKDGGMLLHNADKVLSRAVREAAEQLNLKPHMSGVLAATRKLLSTPGDLEGHLGADGRHYVLDTARLMPCEAPDHFIFALLLPSNAQRPVVELELTRTRRLDVDPPEVKILLREQGECDSTILRDRALVLYSAVESDELELNARASGLCGIEVRGDAVVCRVERSSFLFHLLRPELVRGFRCPLSSDAFSAWGSHKQEENNAEVQEATDHLLTVVVARLASEVVDGAVMPLNSRHLSAVMHSRGLNMRLLGRLRSLIPATNPHSERLRALLLVEMIARVAKSLLRENLRRIRFVDDVAAKNVIVSFFNLMCGPGEKSLAFWATRVSGLLLLKYARYGVALDPEESLSAHHLRAKVSMPVLCQRLQEKTGVSMRSRENFDSDEPFQVEDVLSIVPQIKMQRVDTPEYSTWARPSPSTSSEEAAHQVQVFESRVLSAESAGGIAAMAVARVKLLEWRAAAGRLNASELDDFFARTPMDHRMSVDVAAAVCLMGAAAYAALKRTERAKALVLRARRWLAFTYGGEVSAFGGGHPALFICLEQQAQLDPERAVVLREQAEFLRASFAEPVFRLGGCPSYVDKFLLRFPSSSHVPALDTVDVTAADAPPANGIVFTFGKGENGRLGHGDSSDQLAPVMVRTLSGERVTRIACGDWWSLAVSGTTVWAWGSNSGQFGERSAARSYVVPVPVVGVSGSPVGAVQCVSENQSNALLVVAADGRGTLLGELQDGTRTASLLLARAGGAAVRAVCRDSWVLLDSGVVLDAELREQALPRVAELVVGQRFPIVRCEDGSVHVYTMGFAWKPIERFASDGLRAASVSASDRDRYMVVTDAGAVYAFDKDVPPQPVLFPEDAGPIRQVACGGSHFVACDVRGRVYTWGYNSHGQLGHGHREACEKPTCIHSLQSHFVVAVACGSSHTVLLTGSPDLLPEAPVALRKAADGAGAARTRSRIERSPHNSVRSKSPRGRSPVSAALRTSFYSIQMMRQLRTNQEVVYSFRSKVHTLELQGYEATLLRCSSVPGPPLATVMPTTVVLTSVGEVFVLGRDLSQERTGKNTLAPVQALTGKSVVQAAVSQHACFISSVGVLYSYGANGDGQLGHGDTAARRVPRSVRLLRSVRVVACGAKHTLCATSTGELYSWGCGLYGRLGHGNSRSLSSPVLVSYMSRQAPVAQVAAGDSWSVCITNGGACFSFGYGRKGALGLGILSDQPSPRRVALAEEGARVFAASCGYDHTLFLVGCSRQEAVVWMAGAVGTKAVRAKPERVQGLPGGGAVMAFDAGNRCSVALTRNAMYYWRQNGEECGAPLMEAHVVAAAAGSSYVYVKSTPRPPSSRPLVSSIPDSPMQLHRAIPSDALRDMMAEDSPQKSSNSLNLSGYDEEFVLPK